MADYTQYIPGFSGLPPEVQQLILANQPSLGAGLDVSSLPPNLQAPFVNPLEQLIMGVGDGKTYINGVSGLPTGVINLAQQYGIDPQQVVDTYNTRVENSNTSGNDTLRNFLKDAAGTAALVSGGLFASGALGGAGAVPAVGDVANSYGISPDFLAGGELSPITLPPGVGYVGGATAADTVLPGVAAAVNSGAPVSSLLSQFPEYGSLFGAGASNLFSGGQDPNSPPDLAAPGEQTPGGYGLPNGTQIPNLPGTSMGNIPSWLSALSPYTGLIGAGLGLLDSAMQPNSTTTSQGGTSQSTNSSSLQLPSQITGPASDALARAGQILQNGQQFAPTPYLINHAADQLNTLGQNNAPTTSSFASGANINPYLDMEFSAAADATQNRLGSEFANAGQYGSPQNQQSRSQELQQLAAGIYGPGYQNAQQLQYGAQEAGVARGLQQQDANLNRTLQAAQAALPIGQYMQQSQQQQLNAPTSTLNSYIGQLGGLSPYFPGTTQQSQATTQTGNVTQPLYNNPLLSAIGGAQLGSYVGNLFSGGQQQPSSYTGMQSPLNMSIQPFGSMPAYSYL